MKKKFKFNDKINMFENIAKLGEVYNLNNEILQHILNIAKINYTLGHNDCYKQIIKFLDEQAKEM